MQIQNKRAKPRRVIKRGQKTNLYGDSGQHCKSWRDPTRQCSNTIADDGDRQTSSGRNIESRSNGFNSRIVLEHFTRLLLVEASSSCNSRRKSSREEY